MRQIKIIITCFSALMAGACSIGDWSLVHHIDVQQGNVISQDALNQLTPGMSRRQVQYALGSPMVIDTFHQNRWDYIYRMQPGKGAVTEQHVTLSFANDKLTGVSGTMRPQEGAAAAATHEQVTLVVPPEDRTPPGLLSRFWYWITMRDAPGVAP